MPLLPSAPFYSAARTLYETGLCPIPCGGDDGKRPLVATGRWKTRPSLFCVEGWVADPRFAAANVGILTGLSGITIVDIDNLTDLGTMMDLFGLTPLITATPRGGLHLWYRARGETCCNLRSAGFDVDIKGVGGFVVVPPSIRIGETHAGQAYRFMAGDWTDIAGLPEMAVHGQNFLTSKRSSRNLPGKSTARAGLALSPGTRNILLFSAVLRLARGYETENELIEEALAFNRNLCEPPLPDSEVERAAQSAWRYEVEGRNFSGCGGMAVSYDLIDRLADPEALWLYQVLLRAHPTKQRDGTAFALSPRAMAAAGSAAPLQERAIRRARDRLVEAGVITCIHHGGSGPGDPSRYVFERLDRRPELSNTVRRGPLRPTV